MVDPSSSVNAPIQRPARVTAAGITFMLLAILIGLSIGLLVVFLTIGRSRLNSSDAGLAEPFAGAFALLGLAIGLGALLMATGIAVMRGRVWARPWGIAVAAVLGLWGVGSVVARGPNIVNVGIACAGAFIVYAVVTGAAWFEAWRSRRTLSEG
jgi:hypothetical protein